MSRRASLSVCSLFFLTEIILHLYWIILRGLVCCITMSSVKKSSTSARFSGRLPRPFPSRDGTFSANLSGRPIVAVYDDEIPSPSLKEDAYPSVYASPFTDQPGASASVSRDFAPRDSSTSGHSPRVQHRDVSQRVFAVDNTTDVYRDHGLSFSVPPNVRYVATPYCDYRVVTDQILRDFQ